MASSQRSENVMQCKTGQEWDTNWIGRTTENPDKNCKVYKSGPLLISCKGLGWTSWKKRWFVLTSTSLVFFRTDPATLPQKGSEENLTLGGIDLNNSGSVVVKADKKIFTVLFPDDRAFTLKAETSEDLYDWKAAIENALAQAPSAAGAMGQNRIFCNDIPDSVEVSFGQVRDPQPVNSSVLGRPILLALEDSDGRPSFLEKALRFIEEHGVKVEGILRQSADVEEVKRRLQDYEQGKVEFSSEEDAHVIGDCIKYVLREMPSAPVPTSCCTALVEAYRAKHGSKVDSIRDAIYETFPEPNLQLMQRILKMMQTVAIHKSQNRMSLSALAACMAPLLLRPLLAGDCVFEDDFSMGGDGSMQLMQAAAAANHGQAVIMILLEEYDRIFDEDLLHEDEGSISSELYSDSGGSDVEDDHSTDNEIAEDDEFHDEHSSDDDFTDADYSEEDCYRDDGDSEHSYGEAISGSISDTGCEPHDDKMDEGASIQDNVVHDAFKHQAATVCDPSLQEICHSKSPSISEISLPEDSSTVSINLRKTQTLPRDKPIAMTSYGGVSHQPGCKIPTAKPSLSIIPLPEDSTKTRYGVPTNLQKIITSPHDKLNAISKHGGVSHQFVGDFSTSASSMLKSISHILPTSNRKIVDKSNKLVYRKPPSVWGQTSAKKKHPKESTELSRKDEVANQNLRIDKNNLKKKISKEDEGNAISQESSGNKKEALEQDESSENAVLHQRRLALEQDESSENAVLHQRRLALEQDIERLCEQLQNERSLRASLESGLMNMRSGNVSLASAIDNKTKADLEEVALIEADIVTLKQKVADLHVQHNDQLKQNCASICDSCRKSFFSWDQSTEKDRLETDRTISSYCQQENVSGKADLVSGVTCDSMTVKEQEFASKEKERHLRQNRETNGQNGSASGTKSSSPKDAKTDAQGLPSPSNEPPSDQAYENQKKASATLSCNSPREEQSLAIHNAKKSTSRDNETNGQPSQRPRTLPTQKSRPSSVAGKGPSVEESARAAPKKFSLWGDNSKKEAHDPSMPNKQSSHKKLSGDQTLFNSKFLTASVLPEELSATGRTGGAKGITFRPEEAVAQSMSALNKLTNRLNFLKERRAQLDQHVPHHGSTPNAQRTEFR